MPNPRKPELLAPAGGPDAAYAALHYGADAVYLGLPRFSARADAVNFTPETLDEVLAYAHSLTPRRAVFVTVNTLIRDAEMEELVRLLGLLADLRADGVIVQDLGVARVARRNFASLRLLASTQMAAHSLEGVMALKDLGFSRVILARELEIKEIRRIARDAGVDVEVFIHGALCYSYSGLCSFSSHATGRSGNRGRCAYCCRELFKGAADGGGGAPALPYSMKDLALGDRLSALADAGVASVKIEGRMKNALYVASVTDYYRRRLDGRLSPADVRTLEEDLQTVFSRPWTKLYADGLPGEPVSDPVNVGHRGAVIGRVTRIIPGGRGEPGWLRFTTGRALEKHDGIQIDLPGEPRPFGFAVNQMRVPGSNRASEVVVAAGRDVEILLPAEHPFIPPGAVVYCSSSNAVKRRYPFTRPGRGKFRQTRPLRVAVDISRNGFVMRGTAESDPGLTALVRTDLDIEPAKDAAKTRAAIELALSKLGGTEWALAGLEARNAEGLFVPASALNEARRRLAESLTALATERTASRLAAIIAAVGAEAPARGEGGETWSLKLRDPSVLGDFGADDLAGCDEFVLVAGPDADAAGAWGALLGSSTTRERIRGAVPVIVRQRDAEAIKTSLRAMAAAGVRRWEVANAGGLVLLRQALGDDGVGDVTSDSTLHCLNRQAALQLDGLGVGRFVLSPEDDAANLTALLCVLGARAVVPVLHWTPLFVSETPPRQRDGKDVADGSTLVSPRGDRYRIVRDGSRSVTVSERPFCLSARLGELRQAGGSAFRVDLSYAPPDAAAVADAWRKTRAGQTVSSSHEGNYRRGLA